LIKKVLLQKIIEQILIKKFFYLLVKGSFTENYRINLDQKGSFTENYQINLDKEVLLHFKGSFTETYRRNLDQKGSFTENYQINLDQKGSFTSQRFFYRKLSKKS
jgi:dTDP-4-dehydrorhamnose 3,5-epimerase-like enzyme